MSTDNQRFNNPAAARAYTRKLAHEFEAQDGQHDFLGACDLAQAALVRWLYEGVQYDNELRVKYNGEVRTEGVRKTELGIAWNKYSQAAAEFQLAKEQLKTILSRSNIAID